MRKINTYDMQPLEHSVITTRVDGVTAPHDGVAAQQCGIYSHQSREDLGNRGVAPCDV
jgi:hypothetical protein